MGNDHPRNRLLVRAVDYMAFVERQPPARRWGSVWRWRRRERRSQAPTRRGARRESKARGGGVGTATRRDRIQGWEAVRSR